MENSLPDILRVGKWVKPLPGTGEVIERTSGRVARLALTCPVCHETTYDFLGVNGEKLVPGRRRKLDCPFCAKVHEKKVNEWRAKTGWTYYYGQRTGVPYPRLVTQLITIREG